jgi:hypothetical protein
MKQSVHHLSLLACAGLVLLAFLAWTRSFTYATGPSVAFGPGMVWSAVLDHGSIYFEHGKIIRGHSRLQWANGPATTARILRAGESPLPGFRYGVNAGEGYVRISMVYFVLMLSLPFLHRMWRMQRHWMARESCRGCGYELRRHHDRCPRCGELICTNIPIKRFPARSKAV